HLEAFQAVKLEGTRKSDQRSILDFCEGSSKKLPPNDPKQKRFDEAVLNLLASNRASFHALNTDEFRDIVNIEDPKLPVKSRQAMLTQMSKIVKTKVLPDIRKELNTIDAATISLDLWTSHRKDGVLANKIFYINSNFVLKKRTIAIIEVNERHDAPYICKMIMNILKDFNIVEKFKCIVTDNRSSVIKAMKDLIAISEKDDDNNSDYSGEESISYEDLDTEISDIIDEQEIVVDSCNKDNEIDSDIEFEDVCTALEREVLIEGIDATVQLLNNVLQLVEPSKERIPFCAHVLQLVFKSGLEAKKKHYPIPV
ncbi:unnamed protein product, partial [Allacma fusca]